MSFGAFARQGEPHRSNGFFRRASVRAGNAARLAAAAAKQKLFDFLADKLEANVEDLIGKERKIFVKGSPEKGMTFLEALKAYQYADLPMPIGRMIWCCTCIPKNRRSHLFWGTGGLGYWHR